MEAFDETAVGAIAQLARTQVDVKLTADGIPFAIVPKDHKVEWLDKYMADRPPIRKEGTPSFVDDASLVEYWQLFHDESSRLFADPTLFTVTAVLDYHHVGTELPARHRKHVATFTIAQTPEWATWQKNNGVRKSQLEFAEFIEDNAPDISDPAAADMMIFARELEATKTVNFASAVRTSNGQTQFTYQEEARGTVGKGKIEVPELFKIKLRAFVGAPPVEVEARWRYRINDQKLTMWYDLLRPHRVKEDAFEAIVKQISEKTSTPVLIGKP